MITGKTRSIVTLIYSVTKKYNLYEGVVYCVSDQRGIEKLRTCRSIQSSLASYNMLTTNDSILCSSSYCRNL